MANLFHITADHHMFVGDDRRISLPVYVDHSETTMLDVNGHDLIWQLRHSDTSPTVLIEKSTGGSPAGITIEGVFHLDPLVNTQRVVITLAATDSYPDDESYLTQKNYRYSLKRTNTGARSTLMYGDFQFLYAATSGA